MMVKAQARGLIIRILNARLISVHRHNNKIIYVRHVGITANPGTIYCHDNNNFKIYCISILRNKISFIIDFVV